LRTRCSVMLRALMVGADVWLGVVVRKCVWRILNATDHKAQLIHMHRHCILTREALVSTHSAETRLRLGLKCGERVSLAESSSHAIRSSDISMMVFEIVPCFLLVFHRATACLDGRQHRIFAWVLWYQHMGSSRLLPALVVILYSLGGRPLLFFDRII
jgi:hypothetical protein